MKHFLLISFLLFAQDSFAATRCIPATNNGIMPCDPIKNASHNEPDTESICTIGTTSVQIQMLGVCSTDLAPIGTVADTVNISTTQDDTPKQCWCRLIRPAVSKWVAFRETSTCNCGNACRLSGTGDIAFRQPLFHNFIY